MRTQKEFDREFRKIVVFQRARTVIRNGKNVTPEVVKNTGGNNA